MQKHMLFAGRQKSFQITEVYSLTKKRRTDELAINPTVQLGIITIKIRLPGVLGP